jgi:hypothetical protein
MPCRPAENTIEDKAVIGGRPAAAPSNANNERFKEPPSCIFHQQSRQVSLLKSYLDSGFKRFGNQT